MLLALYGHRMPFNLQAEEAFWGCFEDDDVAGEHCPRHQLFESFWLGSVCFRLEEGVAIVENYDDTRSLLSSTPSIGLMQIDLGTQYGERDLFVTLSNFWLGSDLLGLRMGVDCQYHRKELQRRSLAATSSNSVNWSNQLAAPSGERDLLLTRTLTNC